VNTPTKDDLSDLDEKVLRSLKRTTRQVYEERARVNETVSICRDGKVLTLPAAELLKELDAKQIQDSRSM
jgi:hypothetical protein